MQWWPGIFANHCASENGVKDKKNFYRSNLRNKMKMEEIMLWWKEWRWRHGIALRSELQVDTDALVLLSALKEVSCISALSYIIRYSNSN